MRQKTYKRELATALMSFLLLLTIAWVFFDNKTAGEAVALLLVPFVGLTAGAFGIDEYSKNIMKG